MQAGDSRSLHKNAVHAAKSQARQDDLASRAKFQADIEKVMGEETWNTYTPESSQGRYAELALMRDLNRRNLWHRADDAWQAALMPQGSLVRRIESGLSFFVMRACDAAVLLWPAAEVAVNLWEPDQAASSLQWHVVLDLDDWQELPLRHLSPLHAFVEDRPV
jgi:hypothetical protein